MARTEFIGAMLSVLLSATGCSGIGHKVQKLAIDQQAELSQGGLRSIPLEIDAPSELKLEVTNLEGDSVYLCLVNRTEKDNIEAKLQWRYLTAFSATSLTGRFDSGWRKIAGPAIYSVVLKTHDAVKPKPTVVHVVALVR